MAVTELIMNLTRWAAYKSLWMFAGGTADFTLPLKI
jgi:hypothetical protein